MDTISAGVTVAFAMECAERGLIDASWLRFGDGAALLRALRRGDRRAWLPVLAMALVSLFVHRLALLAAVGAALVYLVVWPPLASRHRVATANPPARLRFRLTRLLFALLTLALAAAGVAGLAAGFSNESRGAGGHLPAGPLQGLWLALAAILVIAAIFGVAVLTQ